MKKLFALAVLMLISLVAGPFNDPSQAQTGTPKPKPPTPTVTVTPFVSHRVYPDNVLYTPEQLQAAYDVKPLLDAGFDGDGQTIALVEIDSFVQKDIDSFVKRNHLPTPHIETILFNGAKFELAPPNYEATADIETVLSIAPKATILVYQTDRRLDLGVFTQIVDDERAKVAVLSIGGCEPGQPASFLHIAHKIFSSTHDAHISLFFSSGDAGAYGCQGLPYVTPPPFATKLAVADWAADPSVTAVGGTLLHLKNGQYSEEVFNSSYWFYGASGGGVSSIWPIPYYQKDYLLKDLNPQQTRQVPDVAASADNFGFIVNGTLTHGGGTSYSAPLWAAGTLLVDQFLNNDIEINNPLALLTAPEMLYQLKTAYMAGKLDKMPFHEITKGDNRHYIAGPGYNLATGLGSPDFYNIALDTQQLYRDQSLSTAVATQTARP